MILERFMYRDPLDVLINHEARTCAGCRFEKEAFERKYCDKGKRYGRHCKQYEEVFIQTARLVGEHNV